MSLPVGRRVLRPPTSTPRHDIWIAHEIRETYEDIHPMADLPRASSRSCSSRATVGPGPERVLGMLWEIPLGDSFSTIRPAACSSHVSGAAHDH